ncbi:hypothetical protein DXB56_12475 [Clostridium sp. OM04-7]|jgi:hypothetical protein|uniref:hypothetical protein n=1 Tax=Clostridium sp. OM04-7 TaxID=2293042 RepID=UPI000E503163|nr:hypothetical protein [Clostridium sp. OM04-7]RHV30916.1 hypothetical protein DXB56_12475 [Clostridium sp. OM04-7]
MGMNDKHNYDPTKWVDNSEPDIDAEHLNKIESALQEYGVSIDELAAAGGTAAKVKTTDTYGLVVSALGESTAQVLIDAIANKVVNELINKNKIVNNLLATDASTVLAGTQGTALDKRLVAAEKAVTQLNSDIKIKFYGKVTDLSVIKTLCQQEYECWVGYIDWKNTEILPSTGGTMLWFAFDWIVCGLCYGKMFYLNMDTLTWS